MVDITMTELSTRLINSILECIRLIASQIDFVVYSVLSGNSQSDKGLINYLKQMIISFRFLKFKKLMKGIRGIIFYYVSKYKLLQLI